MADDLSRQSFQVAYDGDSDMHAMEVQELAPALLAFGRLVREANAELNGKRTTVKVLVESDFEHKCFNINFEVVQSILDMIADFLTSEEVKTARQILVDLGPVDKRDSQITFSMIQDCLSRGGRIGARRSEQC